MTKCENYADILRTQTLLVSEDSYFNLLVKLSNYGDDSYNTSLTMYYPLGLSFSRMKEVTTSQIMNFFLLTAVIGFFS